MDKLAYLTRCLHLLQFAHRGFPARPKGFPGAGAALFLLVLILLES